MVEVSDDRGAAGGPRTGSIARWTPTPKRVLRGVHSGLLDKQIAYDLGIVEATVKAHITAVMRKLNVRNRSQVAMAAQALGSMLERRTA